MRQPTEEPNPGSFVLNRLKIKAMLPSLAVNAIIPYLIYQIVTALGYSTFAALIAAAVAPAAGTVAGLVKNRRADVVGIVSLVFIAISMVTSLISGNLRFLLIKESFITGSFGLACFASLLLPRPAMFYVGRQFSSGGDPKIAARFDALWEYQSFRFATRLITIVWGLGYIFEALTRILLLFILPIPIFLLASQMMALVVTVALIAWSLSYTRRLAKRRALGAKAHHSSRDAA